ncbi:hypothetical protein [Winogradskyella costae]|uniref:hypothetical protein n=1 Tax=Winogradskyella costae TaxID=2697008 RepID=UPI0015CD9048|nr:hypothetical protein [Winogradskyella costae]
MRALKRKIEIYLALSLMILALACNDYDKSENKDIEYEKGEFEFELYYADTIQVNKTYRGLLLYNADSDIDSITSKLEHEKDTIRILTFYLNYSKRPIRDSLQEIIDDPNSELFGSNTPDSIYYEYKFKETGKQFIEGVLEDDILYPTMDKDYPLNTITKHIHISCPVYVTDDTNFKNKIGSLVRKTKDKESETLLYNLNK